MYHNSPSRNIAEGIAATTLSGIINLFPKREKNAFFKGFQNPLTPSYFSNIHLFKGTVRGELLGGGGGRLGNIPVGGIVWCAKEKTCTRGFSYVFNKVFWIGGLQELRGESLGYRLPFSPRQQLRPVFVYCCPQADIRGIEMRPCSVLIGGERLREYLASLPSHQWGMIMSVIPLAKASWTLSASSFCIVSKGIYTLSTVL